MKKYSLLSLLSMLILVCCSSGDSPHAVAEKFINAIGKSDYDEAKKYGNDDTQKLLDMMAGFKKMESDSSRKEVKYEITHDKIEGEKATVYYKEEGHDTEIPLQLVKTDGKWKVSMSKETLNGADGNSPMETGATNTDSAATDTTGK